MIEGYGVGSVSGNNMRAVLNVLWVNWGASRKERCEILPLRPLWGFGKRSCTWNVHRVMAGIWTRPHGAEKQRHTHAASALTQSIFLLVPVGY